MAAGRNDRRLLLWWQALWRLPVSRGRRPISPSRVSRGANLPGASEGRAPLRRRRCQLSEGVSPPSLKPAAFGLCAPAGMRFRLPSPAELGAVLPLAHFSEAPGPRSPAAAPNPPSPEGCLVKADLRPHSLLRGGEWEKRVQGGRESQTPKSVAQAVAPPPSRSRHPAEVGPGTAQETRAGIGSSARTVLFLLLIDQISVACLLSSRSPGRPRLVARTSPASNASWLCV